jgi:hypothetical protein
MYALQGRRNSIKKRPKRERESGICSSLRQNKETWWWFFYKPWIQSWTDLVAKLSQTWEMFYTYWNLNNITKYKNETVLKIFNHSFCTFEEYLRQSWFKYCIKIFIIVVYWFKILRGSFQKFYTLRLWPGWCNRSDFFDSCEPNFSKEQCVVVIVSTLLEEDRRKSCEEIAYEANISAACFRIVSQCRRRVAAKWVPHQLSE